MFSGSNQGGVIYFAIRAVMSRVIKEQIDSAKESECQPMLDKKATR